MIKIYNNILISNVLIPKLVGNEFVSIKTDLEIIVLEFCLVDLFKVIPDVPQIIRLIHEKSLI